MSTFAGVAFIQLWNKFINLEDASEKTDMSLFYLSLSMMCWALAAAINVFEPKEAIIKYYILIPISSLNSLFLLRTIPYFDHNQRFFNFFEKLAEKTNGIICINKNYFSRCADRVVLIIILITWSVLLFSNNPTERTIYFPDFILSTLTLICIGALFHATFFNRKLEWFTWLSWTAIIITFIAETTLFNIFSNVENLLMIIFKSAFINIYLSLALSFVWERSSKKSIGLKESQDDLKEKNKKLEERIKEIELLKGEMGHRVKNILVSLDSVIWLEEQKPEIKNNEVARELSQNLRLRITAVEQLHRLISDDISAKYRNEKTLVDDDNIGYIIPTNAFLSNLKEALQNSIGKDSLQFNFEMGGLPEILVAQAQQIAMVITELIWNSYKRNFKNTQLLIELNLSYSMKDELKIDILDGNRYEFEIGKGFGSFFIQKTVEVHWLGSIKPIESDKGTVIRIVIPNTKETFTQNS